LSFFSPRSLSTVGGFTGQEPIVEALGSEGAHFFFFFSIFSDTPAPGACVEGIGGPTRLLFGLNSP